MIQVVVKLSTKREIRATSLFQVQGYSQIHWA